MDGASVGGGEVGGVSGAAGGVGGGVGVGGGDSGYESARDQEEEEEDDDDDTPPEVKFMFPFGVCVGGVVLLSCTRHRNRPGQDRIGKDTSLCLAPFFRRSGDGGRFGP